MLRRQSDEPEDSPTEGSSSCALKFIHASTCSIICDAGME
jgi:hypothetical protein